MVRTSSACSNSNFKIMVTLHNNTEAGKRVSATRILQLLKRRTIFQAQTIWRYILVNIFQPKRILSFEAMHYQSHIDKLYTLRDKLLPYELSKCCIENIPTAIRQASHVTRSWSSFQEAVRSPTTFKRATVNLIIFYKQL